MLGINQAIRASGAGLTPRPPPLELAVNECYVVTVTDDGLEEKYPHPTFLPGWRLNLVIN